MSKPALATDADPTPTPTPASEERLADAFGVDPAEATSLDALPPDLRDNPFVRFAMETSPEEDARLAAQGEADVLYGDDPERILAAIESGAHPLIRRREGQSLPRR